jgi:hypothetical protein
MATRHAVLFVHTDEAPAFRTRPSLLLSCDKLVKPNLANVLKVLNHAHAILRSVAFVQLPKSRAGESGTRITERRFARCQLFTDLDPADNAMLRFALVLAMAPRTSPLVSKMADTQTTVHPAGRNQNRGQ